ncbi:MAG: PTPDL family protein [Prosthecobacter sp.]|nr:PTPDL family protein [Prosthecobacter sp.]
MKLSRLRLVLLALACSAGFLHADIITLKDGKKLEGNILSETPEVVRMRYKLTPKIWDEKDIPRTDIAEILKQKPEEVELIELQKLFPTVDLMTAEKYEQLIQDRLRPFVNRYPGTKEAAEAEKMIATAQEEKEKVVSGGMKVEGKWLTPDEAKADSYNIKAYGVYAEILAQAEARDYSGALKEFDKIANYQRGHVASVYYPKAVETTLEVLAKYEAQIEQMIKDQPALQRMRDEGVKKLIEPDLTRMKDAIAREKEQWKDGYDVERKSGARWFTPYKYDLPSLKILSKTIIAEKARLKEIDTAVIGKINQAIAEIMRSEAAASKDGEALKKMGEAILAGETAAAGADATSRQFYSTIFQGYRQRYAYAQQQLAAKSVQPAGAAAPGAVGGSTAVGGSGTPGMDDRVAAALAAAGGTAPAVAAPQGTPAVAPAPGATPAMPAGTPVPAPTPVPGAVPGTYPAAQPGYAPAAVPPAAPAGYSQPPPAAAMPMTPPVEESAGISTNTLILIGIGVVVLVLVVAMSGGKKKK